MGDLDSAAEARSEARGRGAAANLLSDGMARLADRFAAGHKTLLGVVHLSPLPSSPRAMTRVEVLSRALFDAEALVAGGLDGFIVENFGDAPFYGERVPAWTVADMAVLVERLRAAVGKEPLVGVNVLRNDATAALAIAAATGAAFIRVNVHTGVMHTDQGTLTGRAQETLRQRRSLDADVDILADVAVKHALAPAGFDLAQAAKDTALRGLADGLIVTGSTTGGAADLVDLETVKRAVPERALLVGSGVTAESVAGSLTVADGVIVGTSLKRGGRVGEAVELARVQSLVARARG